MDTFDIGQLVLTIILGAAPWMFPTLSRTHQIIFFLFFITVSVVVAYFKLRRKYSELGDSLKAMSEKHQALAEQYAEKQREILRYEEAFRAVESLIHTTAQSSSKDRLSVMTEYFEFIKFGLMGPHK